MSQHFKKYKVIRKVRESELVSTLYLKPENGHLVEEFLPGQHLLFKMIPTGQTHAIQRFYSFSDGPKKNYYRISVKKELPPSDAPNAPTGKGSSFLHEIIQEGQIIEAKGPMGSFYLDVNTSTPVILIAGGIGITPLLSMINAIAATNNQREVWLFFGVSNSLDHIFKNHLEAIKQKHKNIHVFTCYTNPLQTDILGVDYDYSGFVDIDFIKQKLPASIKDFYICGPNAMMKYITSALQAWGVASSRIFTESFGPASISYQEIEENKSEKAITQITFAQSGKTLDWDNQFKSIVELAEANDIEISIGCLFGDCGTCMTPLLAGKVKYNHPTMIEPDTGTCLPCSCRPDGPITLEI